MIDTHISLGLLYLLLGASLFIIIGLTLRIFSYSRRFSDNHQKAASTWITPEPLEIIEIIEESPNIKSFCMRRLHNQKFPKYLGGQFLSFEIAKDKRCLRSYSISSSILQQSTIQISVKLLENGVGSTWFHKRQVGDLITAYPPSGNFTDKLPLQIPRIYIAGGIGITPFISMLSQHVADGDNVTIYLFFAARNEQDLIYHHYFIHLTTRHSNIHYYPILSSTDQTATADQNTLKASPTQNVKIDIGRISYDYICTKTPENILSQAAYFFCGPPAMSKSIIQELERRDIPEHHIISEKFISPSLIDLSSIPNIKATLTFQGQRYIYKKRQDILSFLEDQGENIPYACRSGVCGSCAVKITGKHIMLTDAGLTHKQKKQGYALACVSYPQEDLKIALS